MTTNEHTSAGSDDKIAKLKKARSLLLETITLIDREIAQEREKSPGIPMD